MKSKADGKRRAHPALETIKERVAERVRAAGLSNNEASRRADLSLSYVNDLLSGKSLNPVRELLTKLAKALNTDVEYFYGEQDEPRIAPTPIANSLPTLEGNDAKTFAPAAVPLFHIGLTDPDGFFALSDSRRTTWSSPVGVSQGDYCITVPDDLMAPRYRIGEVVIVSPSKPVVAGGFVIVCQTDDRVAIREVITISPETISVRCLKGEVITEIPRSKVKELQRIIGCCELS